MSNEGPSPQITRFDITLRSLLMTAGVVAGAWALIQLIPILLVVVGALIFAGTADPAVQWLERYKVRRVLAIGLVFGTSFVVLAGLGLLILPPLGDQLMKAAADAPEMQDHLVAWLNGSVLLAPAAEAVKDFDPKTIPFGAGVSKLAPAAGGAIAFLGYLASSVVLSLYLVLDRERSRGGLYAIIPRRYHVRLARILLRLGSIVGGYMRGQLITSAAIFFFAFALLTVCKVPAALALAAFAGLTDVIPFVGGLLATTPAALAALSVSPWSAVTVLVAMILYQEFESRVLVPRIYGRTLRLSSATVIIALLVGGKLLGIIGALLALPVAAALRMILEELRVELPGDDSAHATERDTDARAEREYIQQAAGAPPEQAAEVAGKIADQSAADNPQKDD